MIEIDPGGDSAWSETYGIAHHRTIEGPDRRNLITGFRYVDVLRPIDGAWRIARRTAITDWSRIDRPGDWWPVPPNLLVGSPGRDDPSYG